MTSAFNLRFQRRVAARVLGVGKNRVWMDPSLSSIISSVKSYSAMRKQVKDGTVAKRSIQGHCRYHANKRHEEKLLGRHSGMGKRKGTRNARCSQKTQHILRIRAHRSILKRYSAMNKISKAEKQRLYMEIKGNRFKSSKNLIQEMVQRRIKEGKDKVNAVLQKKMIEKSHEKRQKKETSAANRIQAKIDALRLQKNVEAASQSKQIK